MEGWCCEKTIKGVCAIAYHLFSIPLLIDSSNEVYKSHVNQGLNLLIFSTFISLTAFIIPVIGWFLILPLGGYYLSLF